MNLSDYQTLAARTAGGDHRQTRAILGYYGELHEAEGCAGDALVGELGDRLWYLAEICTTHDLKLSECTNMSREWRNRGWLAEARKKHLRGDFGEAEYRVRVAGGGHNEMARLAGECWRAGTTVEHVAERNIAKLADRAARGVISGDGGER